MKRIYKYRISVSSNQQVDLPVGAEILTTNFQWGIFYLWATVDPSNPMESRNIYVRGTGHEFSGEEKRYINTVFEDHFVWHVFEG